MSGPLLVVYPPDGNGWRRVRYDGQVLGTAYQMSDIPVFLAAAGMADAEDIDLSDPEIVEWRGGGPDNWAESPP